MVRRHMSVSREGYVSILQKGNALHSNKVVPRFIAYYNRVEDFYSLVDEKSDSFSNRISDLTIPMDDVASPRSPTSESIVL